MIVVTECIGHTFPIVLALRSCISRVCWQIIILRRIDTSQEVTRVLRVIEYGISSNRTTRSFLKETVAKLDGIGAGAQT